MTASIALCFPNLTKTYRIRYNSDAEEGIALMWNIIFYGKGDGSIPVADFLGSLPTKHHAKALRDIDVLEKY